MTAAAALVGKYGAVAVLAGLAARAVAKVWPESAEVIETLLGALGL